MLEHDAARRLVTECLDLLTDKTPAEIDQGIAAAASLSTLGIASPKAIVRLKYLLAVHPLAGVDVFDYAVFQNELSKLSPSLSITELIQTVEESRLTGRTLRHFRVVAMGPLTGHEDTDER